MWCVVVRVLVGGGGWWWVVVGGGVWVNGGGGGRWEARRTSGVGVADWIPGSDICRESACTGRSPCAGKGCSECRLKALLSTCGAQVACVMRSVTRCEGAIGPRMGLYIYLGLGKQRRGATIEVWAPSSRSSGAAVSDGALPSGSRRTLCTRNLTFSYWVSIDYVRMHSELYNMVLVALP